MRYPFGISLFFILLTFPVWITLVWYGQRIVIQLEAQRELQEVNSLEWLAFSSAEAQTLLRWEHDHEFVWEGRMYDVKEKQITVDSVFLLCYLDEKEADWIKVLANWNSDAPGAATPTNALLISSFLHGYFCQSIDLTFPEINPESPPQPQPQPPNPIGQWAGSPPVPPPRMI